MKIEKRQYIKYVILFLISIFLTFSNIEAKSIEECFFKAHLKNPAQYGPVYRFQRKLYWDIGVDYFDGNIRYFPIVRDSIVYFGGTCVQATVWRKKISPLFTIINKSKEEYMAFYKFHHESDSIYPLHIEPEE